MMNMHWGPEMGFGMFLNEDEASSFAQVYADKNGIYADAAFDFFGNENAVLSNDDYDLRHVWHLDGRSHKEDDDDFVYGVVLYSKRQGGITSTANIYTNLDEMANEFRDRYGDYLPQNFDYLGHLCFLMGAKIG